MRTGEHRRFNPHCGRQKSLPYNYLIVVNFLQSRLTGDPEGAVGHLAPLAAYDDRQQAALLLDPDRDWYEPYWSPLPALTAAMATPDKEAGHMRGYLHIKRQ